eukprot:g58094.t1
MTKPVPIVCIETGRIFSSIRAAADWVDCREESIHGALKRGCRCGGFYWKRLRDLETSQVCPTVRFCSSIKSYQYLFANHEDMRIPFDTLLVVNRTLTQAVHTEKTSEMILILRVQPDSRLAFTKCGIAICRG